MGRELIKVGLKGGGRSDSPYSSSPKVAQRQEQGEPLAVVQTLTGALSAATNLQTHTNLNINLFSLCRDLMSEWRV